jgi:hypothetical protein
MELAVAPITATEAAESIYVGACELMTGIKNGATAMI